MSSGTSVTTKMHPAARLPRAARREQIVRAAAAAFLTAGYDKTSMEEVARAAGVTRLIVYRIFESKEALYLAVLAAVLDDIALQFEPSPPPLPVPHAATGSAARGTVAAMLLGVARRHPDGFRLLWRHASNQPEFSELFALFKAAATEFAIAAIADISPDPVVVRWAAQALVSHVYEGICLWLDSGDIALDDQFLNMLGAGMRAMGAAWQQAITSGRR